MITEVSLYDYILEVCKDVSQVLFGSTNGNLNIFLKLFLVLNVLIFYHVT